MKSDNKIDISINLREVYRYLGYKDTLPDDITAQKIREHIAKLTSSSELRTVYEKYPLEFTQEDGRFYIGEMEITSLNLWKNLKECDEAYLLGVTIGIGADRLIARAGVSDVFAAAVYQASGATYVESYCDYINEEIRKKEAVHGRILRPRFSPGYGDFTLNYQEDIFRILNLPKHIGVSLTDSMLMSPSKSITAIIGVVSCDCAKQYNDCFDADGKTHKCSQCDLADCPYREANSI